jgi:tripartite-type tricarboxylate transporter receptor subunit TctC
VSHVLAPIFIKNLGYDPIIDFVPVAQVAQGSWVLVANPRVPAHSVPELVAYSKANPGKLNIATVPANALQLVSEAFRQQSGTDIVDVNYQGLTQAMTSLLSGEVHLAFNPASTLLPLIQTGQLRALAVTGATRDPLLPDVPTMAQVGYPGVTLGYWLGVLARAGTSPDIVAKLNADISVSLASIEVEKIMSGLGFERKIGSPDDFAAVLASHLASWTNIAARGGIKPN